jgi:hypothetical protein
MGNILLKPRGNFTIVHNDLLNSTEVSGKAKLLYIYLTSKPQRWNFNIKAIASQMKEGYEWVAGGLNELEDLRLLLRKKIKDGTKFTGIIYYLANLENSSVNGVSVHGKAHNISNTDLSYIKEPAELKPVITLDQRLKAFKDAVRAVKNKRSDFSNDQARAFYAYWTEMKMIYDEEGNAIGKSKKFRMEMEKVFDISRRIDTWIRNSYGTGFSNKKPVNKTVTKNS